MKKQDILTPLGLLLGVGFILYGISLGEVSISAFISASSLAITLGGSFAALLITYSLDEIKLFFKMTSKSFSNNKYSRLDLINDFKEMSKKSRKQGLLSLEEDLEEVDNEFLEKGIELVIDGIDERTVQSILTMKIKEEKRKYETVSKMYKTWGSYAPAFGMIGTLIGLIQMLADLQSPEIIASGMANALITTFYGAILANLILNPIGFNIQAKSSKEVEYKEMIVVGILSIKNNESTSIIEDKLVNFLSSKEQTIYLDSNNRYEKGVA